MNTEEICVLPKKCQEFILQHGTLKFLLQKKLPGTTVPAGIGIWASGNRMLRLREPSSLQAAVRSVHIASAWGLK